MPNNKKVAFVLSGGGAVGAYEIGVWKALRKLGYHFDIVTGTSVGALNGIMVVQKDFHKAYKIWSNITYNDISKLDGNLSQKEIYQKYAQEIIFKGGLKPEMLENLLAKVYDQRKFYTSNIDYGLITFNLSTMKPELKRKKDIPKEKLVDYAIASATCFPAFKIKNIEGQKFIDGGYFDNLPINLAIDMGATEIIAVDLGEVGLKQKTKKFAGSITIIKPHNKLLSMLEFDYHKTRPAIAFGYNDTLKQFGKLEGEKFTFKKKQLLNNSLKYLKKYNHYLKSFKLKEITKEEFNKLVEETGLTFNLDETKIYRISKFNHLLIRRLYNIEAIDIKELIKDKKKIPGIFDRQKIVKTIYEIIFKEEHKKTNIILATLFRKEFYMALYLRLFS